MAYLRAQYDTDGPTMRGLTHNSRLANASTLELFDFGFKRPEWMDGAACPGSGLNFFPQRGESTREQKAVCRGCVARPECLEFAMVNVIKHGIWGGTSERERRILRRERAAA